MAARLAKARITAALDEAPEGPILDRLVALVDEVAELVHNPACDERQADGVPCGSVVTSCEECQRVLEILDRLRVVLAEERG